MAVLEKIRVKFGVLISVIIALALLSFIIDPSTLSSALQSMSNKYDVGKIDGKSISYTDFQEEVERYSTINEIVSGSSAKSEEVQEQIRNTAWQALVDKYLFVKNAKAAGITVGDDEMVALTTGSQPSPIIAQNGAFVDEQGNFSSQAVVDFVKNIDADPSGRLKTYWNFLQNTIYTQQFYAKYGSLFGFSSTENALMLRNAIEDNNTISTVNFVTVPVGYMSMADTTIKVSGAEIKKYYNDHKDYFKQSASRDIEYVVFEVTPSQSDIAAASESFTELYDEFSQTDNMKTFLLKNSDRSLSEYWYKAGELNTISSEINDFVFGGDSEVSPVISNDNTFYAARVMDSKMIPDSAYVKHILLTGDRAAEVADSLSSVIKSNSTSFSNLVAQYSLDQSSSADGELGNIGWMTQTYMIPGFESVISAETNKPFVLKTQYGTHVVMVTKKSVPVLKKQVAIFEKETLASKETYNEVYSRANKFASIANGGVEQYKAAVDTMGVYSHPYNNVLESTSTYGTIDNAKEVTRWAFEAKKGKVSNIITVNNNFFFIVALNDVHKEGYATLKEAASSIQSVLHMKAAGEKIQAEVAEKIKGLTSLEAIAEALETTVSTDNEISFSSLTSQSFDPALVGAVAGAQQGKICGPVLGSVGVYVFEVTGRETESYYTEDDAKNLRLQKNQYNSQMLTSVMANDADVVDNRAHFY